MSETSDIANSESLFGLFAYGSQKDEGRRDPSQSGNSQIWKSYCEGNSCANRPWISAANKGS